MKTTLASLRTKLARKLHRTIDVYITPMPDLTPRMDDAFKRELEKRLKRELEKHFNGGE